MSIITFLIILFFLVLVHEFGHFIVAKKSGIRVDEFAIGFPPRLWTKKVGETLYSFNLLPIGGFVKIFGENPDKESIEGLDKKRSFVHKPKIIQAAVLTAGVFMNVLFAWFLFWIAIMIGLPVPGGYAGDKALTDGKVAILQVLPDSPADAAGFKAGDRIISIEKAGEIYQSAVVEEIQSYIGKSEGQSLTVEVLRGGEELNLNIIPKEGVIPDRAAIGVSLGQIGVLKLSPIPALFESAKITVYLVGAIAIGLFDLIKTAVLGQANLSDVAGPVGIVSLVGEASQVGFAYLLSFAAMISVNLAVLNLLPFPALDGGRLLFVIIEAITRRPINVRVANALNLAGFAILMILMVVITWNDIARLL